MDAGQLLLEKGLLDEHQLETARSAASEGARLDQLAVQLGYAREGDVLRVLADGLGLEFIELGEVEIDRSLLVGLSAKIIHRHAVFPVRRDNDSLIVATSDPFDLYAIDAVAAATGLSVQPVLAVSDEILKLIKAHFGVGSETIDNLIAQRQDQSGTVEVLDELELDGSEAAEMAQEASVVRLVNEILVEAIESRTSDIHIEAHAAGMKIRYRIDGVLQPQPTPPEINQFQAAIVSRLKIMAHMNIAEKRLPQDGRIKLKVSGREVDVRVSMIPMLHGEGIVMRVLDKDSMKFDLRGIGMDQDIYEDFQRLITLPHGILLVTGPTGSGKTTTLYSALNEIKSEDTKIITTEDPVEYQLPGISQIQVHSKIGLTFAAALRSILRHDPDVVLVGEIRDVETAEIAVQASLTGHMVFSTLHTNDAAGAFMRLCDIGVEPFLVASTVEGVMAQRLVRTLCPDCRAPFLPKPDEVPADFPLEECLASGTPIYRHAGCRECRGTGYRGRAGLYELLVANEEIRQLATDRASSFKIKQAAAAAGMRTLRQDGWRKVLWGRTSIEEVVRVSKAD